MCNHVRHTTFPKLTTGWQADGHLTAAVKKGSELKGKAWNGRLSRWAMAMLVAAAPLAAQCAF